MSKKQLAVACIILALSVSIVYAQENIIPLSFKYDNTLYKYDESSKESESIMKADIDGDSKDETLVMFQSRDEVTAPQAFVFVYGQDYEFRIPVYDNPGKIETKDIDNDGKQELFLFSHGGMHYTHLFVYRYEGKKGLHKLFKNGSACPVELEFNENIPTIKVGRGNWKDKNWCYASPEPLWQVYVWNGKRFIYSKKDSTSPEISEEQEANRAKKAYIDNNRVRN